MATTTAEDTTAETDEQSAGDGAAGQPPRGGLNKVKIIGLLVGLIVVMMGIGYWFLPEPMDASETDPNAPAAETGSVDDTVEVAIGNFNTTNTKAGIGVSVQVKFELVVQVHAGSENDFRKAKDTHDARIRDSINRVVRSASGNDLNDPELDTLKRLIREEINKILGTSYVTDVMIPDWQAMDR